MVPTVLSPPQSREDGPTSLLPDSNVLNPLNGYHHEQHSLENFDLITSLHSFLHHIGILPLSSASGPQESSSSAAGTLVNHRFCQDISFTDIKFLLRSVQLTPQGTHITLSNDHDHVNSLLEILSRIALLPAFTQFVSTHFAPILPELASRWLVDLGVQDNCAYPHNTHNLFPNSEKHPSAQLESLQESDLSTKLILQDRLFKIFYSFSLLLETHPLLFSFFLVFMRHPAFFKDPFDILPIQKCIINDISDQPLSSDHPLYNSDQVEQFLLSLYRLLSAVPHLPFDGVIPQGWILPPYLIHLLKHHPKRSVRLLAWHCWRFWQGPAGFGSLGNSVRDQFVWRRNLADASSIENLYTSPWSTEVIQSKALSAETAMPETNLESDDMINLEDQLTGKWELRVLSSHEDNSSASYQVASRLVDAWVIDFEESWRRQPNLFRCPPLSPEQIGAHSTWLTILPHHLSKLVTHLEGHILIRFSVLPLPQYLDTPAIGSSHLFSSHQQSKSNADHLPPIASYIPTESSRAAIRAIAPLCATRLPILLSGPPSCGKNTLLKRLSTQLWLSCVEHDFSSAHKDSFDRNIVSLNLASRTLDAKSLVGSYASSPQDPGKFIFVEGPLVRAMKEGKWLVCQDIDHASDDVLSVINQVADLINHQAQHEVGGGIGGHGGRSGVGIDLGAQSGWISASERFLLIATRTVHDDQPKAFVGEQYWKEVGLMSPTQNDLSNILAYHTPSFTRTVRECFINSWRAASEVNTNRSGRTKKSLRDLLKWVRRIQSSLQNDQTLYSISQNPVLQEQIFLEAVDIFLASSDTLLSGTEEIDITDKKIAMALGTNLQLNEERVTYCIYRRIPDYLPAKKKMSGGTKSKDNPCIRIGRTKLYVSTESINHSIDCSRPFALTKSSLILLERVASCIQSSEPVLLVGETGTGKTSIVSHLAKLVGKNLISLNLSNQSEASDLLGGFKPLDSGEDAKITGNLLIDDFISNFGQAFNVSRNQEFIQGMRKAASKNKMNRLVAMLNDAIRALTGQIDKKIKLGREKSQCENESIESPTKRRKTTSLSADPSSKENRMKTSLQVFLDRVCQFEERFVRSSNNQMRFKFVEGPLIKAIQRGDWVLLDEINLGTPETLESLRGLLQHPTASLILSERGDLEPVPRHPAFRLFGCMNPATDVGKRDLPTSLRQKFTELYVQSPDRDREALLSIISQYLSGLCVSDKRVVIDVCDCYNTIQSIARTGGLADGTNTPPHYSMRTLSRALTFATDVCSSLSLRKALVEGFYMAFVTTLDSSSTEVVRAIIDQYLIKNGKNPKAIMNQQPRKPEDSETAFIQVGSFWLKKASALDESVPEHTYVLTDSVKSKLVDLARAVTTRRYPVLIQGPTSSGKTSIIEYLAKNTGHPFVRINNHEHTDIQEYIGSYSTDPDTGRLCFKEGALVRALRNGEWIVLDELNLAPSDVLEALNRLLDDNRELLIPETQEVVRPHPNFMLFATQNPPGLYGGRKVLSRAFRNRFLELHYDDVPKDELETILCQRCQIAPSYAKRIVEVFTELQRRRQTDRIFEQKHSFVTLRDLFRWGGRGAVGYQELAEDGYMLLAERARGKDEKSVVQTVLEEVMNVKIDPAKLYDEVVLPESLVSTAASKRLFKLLTRALNFHEPVLLVGEAGSGKTSVCEALSQHTGQRLRCINLHRNSEVGDLLGSQRPVRHRAEHIKTAIENLLTVLHALAVQVPDISALNVDQIVSFAQDIFVNHKDMDPTLLDQLRGAISQLQRSSALFAWFDGPLVQAMQQGDFALLDEISLADDSVLERLNSLLEPERSIVLAEKGGGTLENMRIIAHPSFEIMATMNPGGDFGKRELSPALRNRFTEIWVPLLSDPTDRLLIYTARLSGPIRNLDLSDCSRWAERILSFSAFYSKSTFAAQLQNSEFSLRDGLAWCDFMRSSASLTPSLAFLHGAQMSILDRLGTAGFGHDLESAAIHQMRQDCLMELYRLAQVSFVDSELSLSVQYTIQGLTFGDFLLTNSGTKSKTNVESNYSFSAKTVRHNAMRIVRALQVPKAVLLEGSPGVGKTSIVEALARSAGRRLRRINLSDQTDLLDLFGADVPVESGKPGEFAWKDAAFLDAMQNGDWVLLDEMNLAPQTVLEGLNACLDHRGSVYIPELDKTFTRHTDFIVFAAQNPHHQGGSRKGLPRSLVDRFTVVFMKEMERQDLLQICAELAPGFDQHFLSQMVNFNSHLIEEASKNSTFASSGSPWEFNLRDLGRWLEVTTLAGKLDLLPLSPVEYIDMIYTGRFRTSTDQSTCAKLSRQYFSEMSMSRDQQDVVELPSEFIVGHSRLYKPRESLFRSSIAAESDLPIFLRNCAESLIRCLNLNWLPILTGPERVAKSSLVKTLAARQGTELRTISMHSGTDTSDLLGGFEQSNPQRHLSGVIDSLYEVIETSLKTYSTSRDLLISELEFALRKLRIFRNHLNSSNFQEVSDDFSFLLNSLSSNILLPSLDSFKSALTTLIENSSTCQFEWVDGPLLRAMKNGEWLSVENANMCSASVLDRLNPLFEGRGTLQIPERGMYRGEIVTIHPHPNFRIIFAFNPRYGELSRAMRNRGIEIAFLPITTKSDSQVKSFDRFKLSLVPKSISIELGKYRDRIDYNLNSEKFVDDRIVLWTSQLLVQSPSNSPIITRILKHLLPSNHPDKYLNAAYYKLSCSGIVEKIESLANNDHLLHFVQAEALDLATSGETRQQIDKKPKKIIHRIVLILVVTICISVGTTYINDFEFENIYQDLKASQNFNIDPKLLINFIKEVSDLVFKMTYSILEDLIEQPIKNEDISEFEEVINCLDEILQSIWEMRNFNYSSPDYAALGLLVKVIEDSLNRVPESWILSFESIKSLLIPLKDLYDISRWESLVELWNVFCPQWIPRSDSLQLINELDEIVTDRFELMDPELRKIYYEVSALIKVCPGISSRSIDDLTSVAQTLKEKILQTSRLDDFRRKSSVHIKFGNELEKLIITIVTLNGYLNPTRDNTMRINDLFSHWKTAPNHIGVLFKARAYLSEQETISTHVNIHLNLEILTMLTSPSAAIFDQSRVIFEPPNTLAQLTGSSLLQSMANITKLVETTITLDNHSDMVGMIKRLRKLVLDASVDLVNDRKVLAQTLILRLLDLMEKPLFVGCAKELTIEVNVAATREHTPLMRALRLWSLYIPDLPIDPLSVRTAHRSFLKSWLNRLQHLHRFLSEHEEQKTGRNSNTRVKMLEEDISRIGARCESLPHPSINRSPDMGVLSTIFTELKAFEQHFLVNGRLQQFALQIHNVSNQDELQTLRTRVETFSISAMGLFTRLKTRFQQFVDILWPVQAITQIIIAELTLTLQQASVSFFNTSINPVKEFMEPLLSASGSVSAANIRRFPPGSQTREAIDRQLSTSIVPMLQIGAVTNSRLEYSSVSEIRLLVSSYDDVWKHWSADRIREQKQAEQEAQEFKTRRQDIKILEDEEIEAEELQQLFPNYDDESRPFTTPLPPSTVLVVTPGQVDMLNQMHLAITLESVSNETRGSWFDSLRTEIIVSIGDKHGHLLPAQLDVSSLAYQINHIEKLSNRINSTESEGLSRDFYNESNTLQASRVIPILAGLEKKLEVFIEEWPDLTNLDEILQRCHQIRSLASECPLARIIPLLEILIGQIEEWEKYSCSENSLLSYQVDLTSLVISWRRLELGSWATLIERETRTFVSSTNLWWFRLYELLVRGFFTIDSGSTSNDGESYLRDCACVLNEFMTECNQGQFKPRLSLLRSFRVLIASYSEGLAQGSWLQVIRLLDGVIYFYSHYQPEITELVHASKKAAKAEIENCIRLASWKDVNIVALRQSSQKSHRQLYKCVRRFRTALQAPVKNVLQKWRIVDCVDISMSNFTTLQDFGILEIGDSFLSSLTSDVTSPPKYFTQPNVVLNRLKGLIGSQSFFLQDASDSTLEIDSLNDHIRLVTKELSEEKIPRDDSRERFARNLDLRKRRAFAQLLKKLRVLGVGTCPTDRILQRLSDPAVVLSQPLLGPGSLDGMKDYCNSCDDALFGLLNEMTEFRGFRSQHHSDITNSDFQRLIGSVESALHLILSERPHLSTLVTTIKEVEQCLSRMTNLATSKDLQVIGWINSDLLGTCRATCRLQDLFVRAIVDTRDSIKRLGSQEHTFKDIGGICQVLDGMVKEASVYMPQITQLGAWSKTNIKLAKSSEIELVNGVRHQLNNIVERLASLANEYPIVSFLLAPLSSQLRTHLASIPLSTKPETIDRQQISLALRKLIDSVLIVTQKLVSPGLDQKIIATTESEDTNIKKTHILLANFTSKCHLDEVVGKIKDFNRLVSHIHRSDEAPAFLLLAASFVQQYLELISRHMIIFVQWHQRCINLVRTIVTIGGTIAKEGFCKPDFSDDKDDSKGQDGPLTDGTGLGGGGQGAKDVSEEIESEEQIEGLQGDVDEDEREERDKEAEDKAIETQNDLDAPAEDVEERETDDEGGEDEEEDDGKQVEDTVGKVDPLDSGAVDEKFWDEEDDKKDDQTEKDQAELSAKQDKPMPEDSDMTAKDDQGGEQNRPKESEQRESPVDQDALGSEQDLDEKNSQNEPGEDEDGPDKLEGEEEEEEPQEHEDNETVPMMDHVDNSEALNLPEDLELEDPKCEGDEADKDSIMELDDCESTAGDQNENLEQSDELERLEDSIPIEEPQPDRAVDEPPLPESGESGQEPDSGRGVGGGTETSMLADVGPMQDSMDIEKDTSDSSKATLQNLEPSSKEDGGGEQNQGGAGEGVGQNIDGEKDHQIQPQPAQPQDNEKVEKLSKPNPLRDLGNAMEDWKRRLEQMTDSAPEQHETGDIDINDAEAELEYIQTSNEDSSNQQAPGPATEDQACDALDKMQIDDPRADGDPSQPQPLDLPLPEPQEPLRLPNASHKENEIEPAVLGNQQDSRGKLDLTNPSTTQAEEEEDNMDDEEDDEEDDLKKSTIPAEEALDNSSTEVWRHYQVAAQRPASHLTEQLRLILEPTTATRLQGDYRTGKRLNMRKLIPYIASDYTRDRIWLRRTKPAQRDYKILIAVDDSRSMADSRSAHLAFQTLALVTSALSKLEVGEVAIAKFGGTFDILQAFEGGSARTMQGKNPIQGFTFSQQQTDVKLVVKRSLELFEEARRQSVNGTDEIWQLGIIISDGVCQDHEEVRQLLRQALERRVMFVFLILDSLHQHEDDEDEKMKIGSSSSIISMKSVSYIPTLDGKVELKMERYLDSFPFDYYIILRNVEALPNVLSATLRQFFEKVNL